MATFGGFSSNPDIKSFLLAQQGDFIEMVRAYSVLLRASKDSQVIHVAQNQAYPRIGLILSAAKNLDNTYLFSDPGDPTNILLLYDKVVYLMTSLDSPFSEGITRVAAALTAATLIRSIPLDGDIKNVSSAEYIEDGALKDLQEIIKLYTQTKAPSIAATLTANSTLRGNTIYISLDIDKTSLPANWFNINPRDQIARIEELHPTSNVKLLSNLYVDPSTIPLCWYYVTHTDRDIYSSTTTSTSTLTGNIVTGNTTSIKTQVGTSDLLPAVQGVFPIPDNSTADDIVELLADALNEAVDFFESNVIVSPNLEPVSLTSISIIKKKLYEYDPADSNGFYDTKIASFRMLTRLSSLKFDARRLSATINRELIIVRFHTISKVAVAQAKFGGTATYAGQWNNTTTFATGSIVTLDNYDFYAPSSLTGQHPITGTGWKPLYEDYSDLLNYRNFTTSLDYVEGLLYGLTPQYAFLDKYGPHSIIVDVEKGSVKTTGGIVSNRNPTATPVDENDLPPVNTFYFRLTLPSVTGSITCRVSSATVTDVPAWTVSFTDATADDIALLFLNSLYTRSQASDTLGVLVYPHAVEIVAFQTTDEEVKVVVDIIDLPAGLEIATGTPVEEKTPYRSRPRSVCVDAKVARAGQQSNNPKPSDIELLKAFSATASIASHKKSHGLQHVYDKIDFLSTIEKRRLPPW